MAHVHDLAQPGRSKTLPLTSVLLRPVSILEFGGSFGSSAALWFSEFQWVSWYCITLRPNVPLPLLWLMPDNFIRQGESADGSTHVSSKHIKLHCTQMHALWLPYCVWQQTILLVKGRTLVLNELKDSEFRMKKWFGTFRMQKWLHA
jgi:hypothetical protein